MEFEFAMGANRVVGQWPGLTAFVVTQVSTALSQTGGDPPLFVTARTATKRAIETMAKRIRPRISIYGAESTLRAHSAIPRTSDLPPSPLGPGSVAGRPRWPAFWILEEPRSPEAHWTTQPEINVPGSLALPRGR